MKLFKNLWKNEDGATAIEYGLIAALIAVACITALSGVGEQLNTTFSTVETDLTEANADEEGGGGDTPTPPATPAT